MLPEVSVSHERLVKCIFIRNFSFFIVVCFITFLLMVDFIVRHVTLWFSGTVFCTGVTQLQITIVSQHAITQSRLHQLLVHVHTHAL